MRLLVASPSEDPREVAIERGTITARILPEARRIGPGGAYAYLRLVRLAGEETLRGIEQAMDAFTTPPPLEGVILDVRGTRRGAPGVLLPLLSYFLEGEIGAFYTRAGDSPIELPPAPLKQGFDQVPVVVLVDEATIAEAEQLAALLQAHGRAQVVGQPTSGVTHGVRSLDFVGGSRLQMTVIGLRLPDGSILERAGVTPDVLIEADWAEFPEQDDPYLLKAFELLTAGPAPGVALAHGAAPHPLWTIAFAAILARAQGAGSTEQVPAEAAAQIEQLQRLNVELLAELHHVRAERLAAPTQREGGGTAAQLCVAHHRTVRATVPAPRGSPPDTRPRTLGSPIAGRDPPRPSHFPLVPPPREEKAVGRDARCALSASVCQVGSYPIIRTAGIRQFHR